jgi:glucose/arabinose dehydrogenase
VLGLAAVLLLAGCGAAQNSPSEDTRTADPTAQPSEVSTTSASPAPGTPSVSPGDASPTETSSPTGKPGKPHAADVVTGLKTPWGLVSLRNGSTLVSERDTGKIMQIRGDRATRVATLDDVRPQGEGGLLGLTATADERTVFAYFTGAEDNRVVRMSWDGQRLGKPQAILTGIPKGFRHNGGRLVIGPDGDLYVGTGETGDAELAQDKSSLGGKILRVTLDGKPAPGNPFGNAVYSYGHRNVQGLAFDDAGRLWASEFGDSTWDELNLITKGANYGWPRAEGSAQIDGLTNPKVVWRTSDASPSGLAYWQGELWMAALQGQRLWEIPLQGAEAETPVSHFPGRYGRLRSVTVASGGGSLLLTASNTDGRADPRRDDDRVIRVTRNAD